jgi:uncharacterized LabA/DUF88 family protein
MRIVLLVDVNNFFYGVRDARAGARVRYDRLLAWLQGHGEVIAAVAFMAYDPARPDQERFRTALSQMGFRVVEEPLRQENGRLQGNMDVPMALEAIRLVERQRPDLVALGTGDGDFAPLAHHLAQQGLLVWVIAPRVSLSGALARAAHRVFLLEDLAAEVPGLLEAEGSAAPTPEPEAEAGPLERLALRIARALPALAPQPPAPFLLSRLGDAHPDLSEEARRAGGLAPAAALAMRLYLPGWGMGVQESVYLVLPPGARPGPGVRPIPLAELARAGLERLPPAPMVRAILEELARFPAGEAPADRDALEEALAGRLGPSVSRRAIREVFAALARAGQLKEEAGALRWPRDLAALEEGLRRIRAERAEAALAGEAPAFRDRARWAAGLGAAPA